MKTITIALALVLSSVLTAQTKSEQTIFFGERQPNAPVAIPTEVLSVVLDSDPGRDGMKKADEAQQQDPAQMFRAAKIRLSASDENSLVVIGNCPMCSERMTWFWLVHIVGGRPEVILFAEGSSLRVLAHKTRDYYDIDVEVPTGALPTEKIYRSDGRKYWLATTKSIEQVSH